MRGAGEGEKLRVRAVTQTFTRHLRQEKHVSLAPKNPRGDANGLVRELGAGAEERAVPIDHAGQSAGLRPGGAVLDKIFGGESARAARAQQRPRADAIVERGEKGLRQPRELKEEHVPTAEQLTRARAEEFAHHRGMRDVEDRELGDALRTQKSGGPCNGGAPIMPREKDSCLAELIGDSNNVGNEFS